MTEVVIQGHFAYVALAWSLGLTLVAWLCATSVYRRMQVKKQIGLELKAKAQRAQDIKQRL